MDLEKELFTIEQGFWLSGPGHFSDHLDAHCLLVFPQAGEMHGVHARESVAKTATSENRWKDLRMKDRNLLQPSAECAIISYRADVVRADGAPYAALIGSVYIRREAGWKLVSHQHSPI